MRLFDAIINANHRALSGDQTAGIHLGDYAAELPVVAMTCIDPRLNRLFPGVLGLTAESFIWLRNAGNIITDPLSSMTRSLALACAVKGGREIAIIGHTDCAITRTSIAELIEKFRVIGVDRTQLPLNLTEYFGVFSSERQNVIQSVDYVRRSPLISPRVPVQGLMVDTATGNLEWVVNGYDAVGKGAASFFTQMPEIGDTSGSLGERMGEFKFPDVKIGETAAKPAVVSAPSVPLPPPPNPPAPKKPIPVPPPIHMKHGL